MTPYPFSSLGRTAPGPRWEERLFGPISAETSDELAALMEPVELARGAQLFEAGDEPVHLFVLDRGKIKLSRRAVADDPRRESLLTIVAEGQVFGELSVLDPGPRTTTATAVTACRLRRLSGESLHAFLTSHPELALGLAHQLARRLRAATDYASDLVLNDVHGRTARTLLHLGELFGTPTGEGGLQVEHGLTQQEIAHMVGASRESVNKILMELTEAGAITLFHRGFSVLDPRVLREQAEATLPGRLPRD